MFIAGTILWTTPIVFVCLYIVFNYLVKGKRSVCVVVLGDIGRSPRMQYHALSFLETGFSVDVVGYGGSAVQNGLKENENVSIHYLTEPPQIIRAVIKRVFVNLMKPYHDIKKILSKKVLPRLMSYGLKVLWQATSLAVTLILLPKSEHILLQNPPCIPALVVSLLVCWLRRSSLVIDWHNYGYTILGLTLGTRHPLVRFANWYERLLGRFASANICVTKAMQDDLRENWNVRASVMYDRPPAMFKEASIEDQHRLFTQLSQEYPAFRNRSGEGSAFTVKDGQGKVKHLPDRPVLLVSSTSWTEDEDFSTLLDALKAYESIKQTTEAELPDLVCAITGKGPLKQFYQDKISADQWKHVLFCLPWLTPEDYPLLLGSADLGVCLHKSSSDLDLPMKVVDMFGCGLPVCAIYFKCLNELVQHDTNGLVFNNSTELCDQLQELLRGFPSSQKKLKKFCSNLASFQAQRWQPCWEKTVLPLFDEELETKKDR